MATGQARDVYRDRLLGGLPRGSDDGLPAPIRTGLPGPYHEGSAVEPIPSMPKKSLNFTIVKVVLEGGYHTLSS